MVARRQNAGFHLLGTGHRFDIGVVSLDGTRAWKPLLKTKANEDALAMSPDGRWIAYKADDTGRYEVYVERFPDLGDRRLLSTGGGRSPLWSHDGRELFYRGANDEGMSVPITAGASFKSGTPTVVLKGRYVGGNARSYDVTPDGRRFLMIKEEGVGSAPPPQLIHVEHWSED
jgi:eukaryotic-like serine/threonine-protein kinase